MRQVFRKSQGTKADFAAVRLLLPVLVLVVLLPLGQSQSSTSAALESVSPSPSFGAAGAPRFSAYPIPEDMASARNAGEPTIGIPWNTDHSFFQAFAETHRAVFDDAALADGKPSVQWTDVTPAFTPINVDPMLHADYQTGRIFAGGLLGPCSLMGISDDDGATWTPSGNMCSGAQFDHQSIGSGPWSTRAPESPGRQAAYPRGVYYCAQLGYTACATSLDGGRSWLPFTEVLGGCGGLHGHISVSEATGTAAVPHGGCAAGEGPAATTASGDFVGYGYTTDNGVTWNSRVMPDSQDGTGFDPDLVFSQESGWLWVAQADQLGIHIALSKDEGLTWETLGRNMTGQEPQTWYPLNETFYDPVTGHPLVYGSFPDLEAGDDMRVALAFMGTTNPDGEQPFTDCSAVSDLNIWHYYLSQSFDGGQSWTTTRLSEDPVQVGAIWNGGGGDPCRNLLDFNDMDMDSTGRLHIAFADGCTEDCAQQYFAWINGTEDAPVGAQSRDSWGTILRQTTGKGLFAEFDLANPPMPEENATDGEDDDEESPGMSFAVVGLVILLAAAWRRR